MPARVVVLSSSALRVAMSTRNACARKLDVCSKNDENENDEV